MRDGSAGKSARNHLYLRVCAGCAVLLVFNFPGAGQPSQTPAAGNTSELTTHDAPATFRAGVNLVMVPVVVRDRQGHAIGTLKQEDFQLFDKGKPQIISKFSVERPGAKAVASAVQVQAPAQDGSPAKAVESALETAASAIPTRFIAYLFDDVHLEFADLAQARTAAIHHLTATLQPTDRAAIYTTSGQNMLDFTGDLDSIRETLNKIQPRGTSVPASSECPYMTYYMADLIENKSDPQVLHVAEQDAILCANIVVPQTPGGMAAALQQAESVARGAATRALASGENDTKLALSVLRNIVRRMAASPGLRSIVLVSPGFYLPDDFRSDQGDLMDAAIRANVTISALDARGLYVVLPGGDVSEPSQNLATQTQKDLYRRDSDVLSWGTLAELADGTGGTFVHNTNDLEGAFGRVAAAPEFIYILGFSPQNLKLNGSYHALKVTLKNVKDVTAQARRGYYAPKHELDPAEQAKQEIQEAVFSRDEMLDIPLSVQTQFFKPSDFTAKLAVLAKIDLRKLPFRKAEGRNNDALTIVSGVFDPNGNLINAIQKVLEMRLRDETLEQKAVGGIVMRSNFDLTPGSYVIRVVIRDREGSLMAARNGVVEIP